MNPIIYFFEARKHLPEMDESEFLDRMEELKQANPFYQKVGQIIIDGRGVGEAKNAYLGKQCYCRVDGRNFCRKYHAINGTLDTSDLMTAFNHTMQHLGDSIDIHFLELGLGEQEDHAYNILEEVQWNEGVMQRESFGIYRRDIIKPGDPVYEEFKKRLKKIE